MKEKIHYANGQKIFDLSGEILTYYFKDGKVKVNMIVQRNYSQIKQDVLDIVQSEMERLLNDPEMVHLVLRK